MSKSHIYLKISAEVGMPPLVVLVALVAGFGLVQGDRGPVAYCIIVESIYNT